MRHLPALAVLLLLASACRAASWLPADAELHQRLGQRDDLVQIRMYFCGHCPSAAKRMATIAKAVHDTIEQHHLPAVLFCITPELEPAQLKSKASDLQMPGAVFYQDVDNELKISTSNIWQTRVLLPGGKSARLTLDDGSNKDLIACAREHGSYRLGELAGDNAAVTKAWWLIERGVVGPVKEVLKAAERKNAPAELTALAEAITTTFTERAAALVAADPSIQVVDELEALLEEADGLDLDEAEKHLKTLLRSDALEDELTARNAYQKCVAWQNSGKVQQMKQAAAGFAQIAERFPDTHYGKLAAAR